MHACVCSYTPSFCLDGCAHGFRYMQARVAPCMRSCFGRQRTSQWPCKCFSITICLQGYRPFPDIDCRPCNNNNINDKIAEATYWEQWLTVFVGDNSRQAAEVVALALYHAAHPDVIIQVETQWAVIPDWTFSMPGSLKLLQNLQSAHIAVHSHHESIPQMHLAALSTTHPTFLLDMNSVSDESYFACMNASRFFIQYKRRYNFTNILQSAQSVLEVQYKQHRQYNYVKPQKSEVESKAWLLSAHRTWKTRS